LAADQEFDSPVGTNPVARPSRLMEAIVGQLRDLIIEGSLAPGSILRQTELAERLGVSRTPLREALLSLEREGLVESTAGGMSTAAQLTLQQAREAMEVRALVDGSVARLLALEGLKGPLRDQLLGHISQMEHAAAGNRRLVYESAHLRFHLDMLTSLNNRWLDPFATLVRISSRANLSRLRVHSAFRPQAMLEHRAILRAIAAGAPAKAEAAARFHIRRALRHLEAGDSE
jgi:GntR family transcriptional regulator of vanillate catabolism